MAVKYFFTMKRIPAAIKELLSNEKMSIEDIDLFYFPSSW